MSTTTDDREVCPGCGGIGVQRGNDGIVVTCPVCGGIGWIYTEPGIHVTY